MKKETISGQKMCAMLVVFMIGNSIVSGGSTNLKQDAWISIIIGLLIAIPILLIYIRIINLYPSKNIYEVLIELFGNIIGKIIMIFFIWYCFHLGAIVLRNFSEFIQIVSKPETPQIVIALAIIFTSIYLVKSGIMVIGRWSVVIFIIILFFVLGTFSLGLANIKFEYLLPFCNHSFREIMKDSFIYYSFPYAETVVFLSFFDSLRPNEKVSKVFLYGFLISVCMQLLIIFRNITLLGPEMFHISLFPSYVALRIIGIGRFLTRFEGFALINFLLLGISKISLSLFAAIKGVTCLFEFKNYKRLVIPIGLLMVSLSAIIYNNTLEMFSFVNFYPYYAFPFQVIIPVIIWIFAERKVGKLKPKS